jgi:hypothetical protein
VMKIMLAHRLRLSLTTGILAFGLIALGAYGLAQTPYQNPTRTPLDGNQQNPYSNSTANNQSATPAKQAAKIIPRGIEDDDVPYGSLPAQAVVRIEEGKLIIRQRIDFVEPVTQPQGNRSVTSYQHRSQVSGHSNVDPADVTVFDMKGNRLLTKVWKEKLKVDNHVLLSFDGKLPHPRELAIFKEDTLILIMPASVFPPVPAPPHAPAINGYPTTTTPPTYYVPQTSYVPQTNYVPSTNSAPPPPAISNVLPPTAEVPQPPSRQLTPPSATPPSTPPQPVPDQVPPPPSVIQQVPDLDPLSANQPPSTQQPPTPAVPTTPRPTPASASKPNSPQPSTAPIPQPTSTQPLPTPASGPATQSPSPTPPPQPPTSQPPQPPILDGDAEVPPPQDLPTSPRN